MGHGHLGLAVDRFELHDDLGGLGVSLRHAHLCRRDDIAVFVAHGLGVDQAFVGDDLEELTNKPHLHWSVGCLHSHTNVTTTTDPHVHLGDRNGGTHGAVPGREVF